jgi:hypothetical protein
MPERSWSLPDSCNTYVSLYFDNVLDIDCWVDCGTWVPYGTSSFTTCHLDQGYLQIGLYGNLTRGAYTEFDTDTDSTYVMSMAITGDNTHCPWEVAERDDQGNTIVAHTVTQTGTLNLEFTAVGSKSRVYVRRLSSTVTFGSFGLRTLSIDGKYHKEDVMYLSYRYGFNSQEKDDEIYGSGNSYTAEYWQYDARLGRRWNVDPVVKPYESPYATFANNPIWFVDPNGADSTTYLYSALGEDGKPIYSIEQMKEIANFSQGIDRMNGVNYTKFAVFPTKADFENAINNGNISVNSLTDLVFECNISKPGEVGNYADGTTYSWENYL